MTPKSRVVVSTKIPTGQHECLLNSENIFTNPIQLGIVPIFIHEIPDRERLGLC
jgi:hypothetical protein